MGSLPHWLWINRMNKETPPFVSFKGKFPLG